MNPPPSRQSWCCPTRGELGYWSHKIVPIRGRSGRIAQIASQAVELTAQSKLAKRFHKLGGEPLWRNPEYQRLARELHDSVKEYYAALGMSLDWVSRCRSDPERIPEPLSQSMNFLHEPMRKLASAIARCFSIDQY
jgi:signal transduction histidine kinase